MDFDLTNLRNQSLVSMCDTDINILGLQTHFIIWAPKNNVNIAYVDTVTLLKLSERGVTSFVKDDQEFIIESLSDEKFAQLVQTVYNVAKKHLLDINKRDLLQLSKKTTYIKSLLDNSSTGLMINAKKTSFDSVNKIFIKRTQILIHKLILSVFRQICDSTNKKIARDREIKKEHKRIDLVKIDRKSLEGLILANQISAKLLKTANKSC